jgi:hypothetical protein
MHGLKPSDIDALRHLEGAEVTQVCLGPYDIQFNFDPRGNVSVQGRCELIDRAGVVLDIWEGRTKPGPCRFTELFGSPVREVVIDSPRSFLLKFANSLVLRVLDTSDQHESFSVDGLYV